MGDAKYTTKSTEHGLTLNQTKLIELSWVRFVREAQAHPKEVHARFSLDNSNKCAFTKLPCPPVTEEGPLDPVFHAYMGWAITDMEPYVYSLRFKGVMTEVSKLKNFGNNPLRAQGKEVESKAFYKALTETLGDVIDEAHDAAWKSFLFHPLRLAN